MFNLLHSMSLRRQLTSSSVKWYPYGGLNFELSDIVPDIHDAHGHQSMKILYNLWKYPSPILL